MTITDFVTFILSLYFLFQGVMRGFMNSLMIPVSIIVATVLSIIYFQITKDIVVSLIIGLIGPILLNILLKILLKKWAIATNNQIRPSSLSRLAGAILNLAWGWVFIIISLILLAVLPPWGKTLVAVHNDVTNSGSYFFARPFGEMLFAPLQQKSSSVTNDSIATEAKSLAEDPRFQKILQDPEIQKQIEARDMVKLMSNPKMMALVQEIMSDTATMKKVMAIYSSQTAPTTKN